jgi:hypothetical protein
MSNIKNIKNINYLDKPLLELLHASSDGKIGSKSDIEFLIKKAQENVTNSEEFLELLRNNKDASPINQQINLHEMVIKEITKILKLKKNNVWKRFKLDPKNISFDDWVTFGKTMNFDENKDFKNIQHEIETFL